MIAVIIKTYYEVTHAEWSSLNHAFDSSLVLVGGGGGIEFVSSQQY